MKKLLEEVSFPITREKLINKAGKDTEMDAVYRNDSGINLGVVSRKYNLIPHGPLIDGVLEQIEEAKLPVVNPSKYWTSKNGARMFASFTFREEYEILKGDAISPGFMIINSYDRSLRLGVESFIERLVCSNGLFARDMLFTTKRKHTKNLNLWRMTSELIESFPNFKEAVVPKLQKLSQTPIAKKEIIENLNELPGWMQKETLDYLQEKELITQTATGKETEIALVKEISVWDFLNSLTFVSTHSEHAVEQRMSLLSGFVAAFAAKYY